MAVLVFMSGPDEPGSLPMCMFNPCEGIFVVFALPLLLGSSSSRLKGPVRACMDPEDRAAVL